MIVTAASVPDESEISSYLPGADFADAFEVEVPARAQSPEDSFHAIMSSMPDWFLNLFKLRNKIVRPLGLIAPKSAELDRVIEKTSYEAGDKIGAFFFYGRTGHEVVSGADDKHLDFRLSVLRINGGDTDRVIISTIVKTHNIFGKAYLASIMPFHKTGVRTLLKNAAEAGKI